MIRAYDVVVIGAGVVGSATTFLLAEFTDVKSLAVVEKECGVAMVASDRRTNSQTRHPFGGELNYSLAKMRAIKRASDMIPRYVKSRYGGRRDILRQSSAMALAVGDEEVEELRRRYEDTVKPVFPSAQFTDRRDEIEEVEPYVVRGRPEGQKIAAIKLSADVIDFGELARSFIDNALKAREGKVDLRFEEMVKSIRENPDGYELATEDGRRLSCRYLVIAAGAYSLSLAKQIGLGREYVAFPVDGKYFKSKPVIRGKVYTVNRTGVPFANVHADKDWEGFTRYGPTVTPTIDFEKGRPDLKELIKNLDEALLDILFSDEGTKKAIREVMFRNTLYNLPIVGQRLFYEKEVKKMVPSLRYTDLDPAPELGGVRAAAVNRRTRQVRLGEMVLPEEGERGEFDRVRAIMSPSPGASACLGIGYDTMTDIVRSLDLEFDSDKFGKIFEACP